jgi:glycosyltransferase 2 family protein
MSSTFYIIPTVLFPQGARGQRREEGSFVVREDGSENRSGDEHGTPAPLLPQRRVSATGLLISVLVAVAIVVILLRLTNVSPSVILQTLRRVSPFALVLGFLLHMATYVLRSIRFRLLIHSARPPLGSLFEIVTVHNLTNHVLPFRTGELSYFYLVRSLHRVPVTEGLGTLAICRIMDFMAFTLYYPLAVVHLHLQGFAFPLHVWTVLWTVLPFFLLSAALLIVLALRGRALAGFLRRILGRRPSLSSRWMDRILEKIEETACSFQHLGERKVYVGAFLLSMAILGLVYVIGYVLLAGMGYRMGIPLVVFCSTFASLGMLLPLYSFGGFGTLEAGWTVGCLAAGFSKEMGMASGLSFHIIVLGYVSIMGLYGLARIGKAGWAWNRIQADGVRKD